MIGAWRLGNSIDGVQAEYFRVPYAQANLAKIPDDLSTSSACCSRTSPRQEFQPRNERTCRSGRRSPCSLQGPIGLCATAGARLKGASLVIGVDSIEKRLNLSREMGADEVIDFTQEDPIAARCESLTDGRRFLDVAIEALGREETFQACLDATRPGGIVSSLGVYGGKLEVPLSSFVYGIGDERILSTLCPGGKERMRKLMELVRKRRLDLRPAHHAPLLPRRHRGRLRTVRKPGRRRRQSSADPIDDGCTREW